MVMSCTAFSTPHRKRSHGRPNEKRRKGAERPELEIVDNLPGVIAITSQETNVIETYLADAIDDIFESEIADGVRD